MVENGRASCFGRLRHLLVVEDNPGDTRLIKEAFGEAELDPSIHAVATGERALDFVHRRGPYDDAPRPDVVLLDWALPQMDGPEVLDELKTDFPDISVIVMTGAKLRAVDVESKAARADAYLTKPTEPDGYVEAVRTLV